jgi:hypothetical protein
MNQAHLCWKKVLLSCGRQDMRRPPHPFQGQWGLGSLLPSCEGPISWDLSHDLMAQQVALMISTPLASFFCMLGTEPRAPTCYAVLFL